MFKVTPQQASKLEEYESTYRLAHRAGKNQVRCELTDKLTGKVFVQADGETEQKALDAAVAQLGTVQKPKTPGQIAAENEQLKKRVAELEGRRLEQTPPTPPTPPAKKNDDDDKKPSAYAELTTAELVQALKLNNLESPNGKGDAWRKAAIELLESKNATPQS